MPRTPTDRALYERVKRQAKRTFRSWPSARASQWLVAEYQKRGGKYRGKASGGLDRWRREAWSNVCAPGMPRCGTGPGEKGQVCRPSRRVSSRTPTPLAHQLTPAQRRRLCAQKRSRPGDRLSF
ncbi:hypothetical protein WJX74_006072 [Apatococcus lobatus]|uniref:DUF5872 domain-containing protein n=1 Tax=Apatococcus lobatus TaxID=904363 RepID=A0AAW1Q2D4_9CHLO